MSDDDFDGRYRRSGRYGPRADAARVERWSSDDPYGPGGLLGTVARGVVRGGVLVVFATCVTLILARDAVQDYLLNDTTWGYLLWKYAAGPWGEMRYDLAVLALAVPVLLAGRWVGRRVFRVVRAPAEPWPVRVFAALVGVGVYTSLMRVADTALPDGVLAGALLVAVGLWGMRLAAGDG